jgi:hypothetical protein
MKSRSVTKEDQALWDALASIGCICCLLDGRQNAFVSIHHIAGRTQPGAHKKVIPLRAQHHQHDDTDPAGRIGVHPYRARFEAKYGSQLELLEKAKELAGVK